ncbi:hypothetical protein SASPL_105680 [Salvia splendens]|uniref:AAA-type ATPase N-terminal domain-containing protein n=1 Tax=Salvia splendens TaxID=180675 RepID=A0A8X8YLH9_SALSN|nr:hypothetical protein SASPL_105680 [Salvia splendens]
MWIDDRVHVHQHFKVPELNHSTHQRNLFYRRVSLYLTSLPSLEDSDFTNLSAGKKSNGIVLSLDDNQKIHDNFLDARVSWLNRVERDGGSRSFVLRIRKKDKRRILKPYLQHIHAVSDEIEERWNGSLGMCDSSSLSKSNQLLSLQFSLIVPTTISSSLSLPHRCFYDHVSSAFLPHYLVSHAACLAAPPVCFNCAVKGKWKHRS